MQICYDTAKLFMGVQMKFIVFVFALLLLASSAHANPHAVYGLWLTPSKTAQIEIADCGDGTPCGTLVWIDGENPDATLDDQNPDAALRERPMLGIQMLWNFRKKSDGWKKGRIYSPQEGKTYRSTIALAEDGTLQVKGCLGPFCKAQTWTRVEPDTDVVPLP
ncbi:hypothetical protein MNBD_ALPHA06-944 [hydrothermal vent metagenome]|uniref:DUF2147 domain-containing protein n=1 Tax=hydrothermal vent metagenome TaxID=652676 RepID=A0A3B0SHP2_9ZZZZ